MGETEPNWPQAAVGGCLLFRRCQEVSRHPANGPISRLVTNSALFVIPTACMRRDHWPGDWIAPPACAVQASNEFHDSARSPELYVWRQPLRLG